MQVFKFGGASVKDANGVKNIASVLQKVGYKKTLVVVSAMEFYSIYLIPIAIGM